MLHQVKLQLGQDHLITCAGVVAFALFLGDIAVVALAVPVVSQIGIRWKTCSSRESPKKTKELFYADVFRAEKDGESQTPCTAAAALLYLNSKGPVFPKFPASDSGGSHEIRNCFPSCSANSAPTKMPNKFPSMSFSEENSFSEVPAPFFYWNCPSLWYLLPVCLS